MAALGLCCCTQAPLQSRCTRFSLRGASLVAEHGPQGMQAQELWLSGLAAPRHLESSRARGPTRVPCVDRRILNHWTTREVQTKLGLPLHPHSKLFMGLGVGWCLSLETLPGRGGATSHEVCNQGLLGRATLSQALGCGQAAWQPSAPFAACSLPPAWPVLVK